MAERRCMLPHTGHLFMGVALVAVAVLDGVEALEGTSGSVPDGVEALAGASAGVELIPDGGDGNLPKITMM